MSDLTVVIQSFEYHVRRGVGIVGAWQNEPLWCATVAVEDQTLMFSRYDTEDEWYCDAHFGAHGYPYFCHGEGSRSCRKQVATGDLKDALDARKREWGGKPAVAAHGVA